MPDTLDADVYEGLEIAIIGLAGRFPGAQNVTEFWQNLKDGVESISFFSEEELKTAGENPAFIKMSNYVNAKGIVNNVDRFDASFFGFFPKEAEMLDPQQRFFLECAWEALEDAGHNPEHYPGLIGVFAGVGMNTYIMNYLSQKMGLINPAEGYQLTIGNDKDFLTTRVSYKLNLKGPSIDVQTACSTSLTAIYLACQNLLAYQCDMALAGGTSIRIPQKQGYLYEEGMILSPDGHCRAFDAQAGGTVSGNGTAVVVLKRLTDAIADGDHIYAVIKGAACNNDGSMRVGFTAPGVEGQANVIAMAQAIAGVEPDTISYIETHGTGTTLGDPIEIAALTQVFREKTERKGFCAIGSVKPNVGHLDAAAGVTGIIKTALAIKHKQIPPSINFEQPNPKIDFQNSPFFVNTQLSGWESDGTPRRAGVSSFGIGGTNVHVVMEEPPALESAAESRPFHLLILSVKTETALETMSDNLAQFLLKNPQLNAADVAFTYQVGRKAFDYRRAVIFQTVSELQTILQNRDPQHILNGYHAHDQGDAPAVFMFSGQGAQYINMGRALYENEPVFREQIDFCATFLEPELGFDLREIIFPLPEQAAAAEQKLNETYLTQPVLFTIEYALAKLWMEWGIQPRAMIGHSIGEYVAACLAGVFSLEAALTLVTKRGRLMQSMPGGAMLSLPLSEKDVLPLLGEEISLSAINGPALCVVSGTYASIERLEKQLADKGIETRRLKTSHAFHSPMMDPILESFIEEVKRVQLHPPQIPYLSNVTGTWITEEDATSAEYWARHLRQPVRFTDGVQKLLAEPEQILLEVGPGKTLSSLARRVRGQTPGRIILSSLRHPQEQADDEAFILNTLGRLWLAGVAVDWNGFHQHEQRQRLSLPTYPFERQRYWLDTNGERNVVLITEKELNKKADFNEWFYSPSWQRIDFSQVKDKLPAEQTNQNWLIFLDRLGLGRQLVESLILQAPGVITVEPGERFERLHSYGFRINPESKADYEQLIQQLNAEQRAPDRIVHLWTFTANSSDFNLPDSQNFGFYSLIFLTQALAKHLLTNPIKLHVITNNLLNVTGTEKISPEKATLLGPCKTIPQENANVTCQLIDIEENASPEKIVPFLLTEFSQTTSEAVVANRGAHRWLQIYKPNQIDRDSTTNGRLRTNGVYLITGGLGRIGLTFAAHFAQNYQAKLVLVDQVELPPAEKWASVTTATGTDASLQRRINQLQALKASGTQILTLKADVSNESEMKRVIQQTLQEFGQLNGVIHAAGLVGEQALKALQEIEPADCEPHFRTKVHGVNVLAKVLTGMNLDFCLLQSSLAAVLGGFGMTAYAAANCYLDYFALQQNQQAAFPWISVNWEGWQFDVTAAENLPLASNILKFALTPEEGTKVLNAALAMNNLNPIIISTGELDLRIKKWIKQETVPETTQATKKAAPARHARPNLPNPYVAPRNEIEQYIADAWQELLGIDQIGIYDNFFELGGHSLLATQLVSRLRETFKVNLPLRELFESPTIAVIAETIAQASDTSQRSAEKIAKTLELVEQLSEEDVQAMLQEKEG